MSWVASMCSVGERKTCDSSAAQSFVKNKLQCSTESFQYMTVKGKKAVWLYSDFLIELLTSKLLLKADELLNRTRLIPLRLHNTRVDVLFSSSAALVRAGDQFCFLSGCGRLLRHGRGRFSPPRRRGHMQALLKDVVQLVRQSRQAEPHGMELVRGHSRHLYHPTAQEGRGVRVAAAMRSFGSERRLFCDQ